MNKALILLAVILLGVLAVLLGMALVVIAVQEPHPASGLVVGSLFLAVDLLAFVLLVQHLNKHR